MLFVPGHFGGRIRERLRIHGCYGRGESDERRLNCLKSVGRQRFLQSEVLFPHSRQLGLEFGAGVDLLDLARLIHRDVELFAQAPHALLQQQVDAVGFGHSPGILTLDGIVAKQHRKLLPNHSRMPGQFATIHLGECLSQAIEGGRDLPQVSRLDSLGHLVIGAVESADVPLKLSRQRHLASCVLFTTGLRRTVAVVVRPTTASFGRHHAGPGLNLNFRVDFEVALPHDHLAFFEPLPHQIEIAGSWSQHNLAALKRWLALRRELLAGFHHDRFDLTEGPLSLGERAGPLTGEGELPEPVRKPVPQLSAWSVPGWS